MVKSFAASGSTMNRRIDMRKISAKIGVTAVFALALFAVSIPLAHSQGGPADFIVNCNQGKSIQDALDQPSKT